MQLYKILAIIKAILSSLVWGLGQAFNRQFIKAGMFFLIFLTIIFIEVQTGNYGTEFNLFEDKIPGEELQEEITNGFIENYYFNLDHVSGEYANQYQDYSFLTYVAEINELGFVYNPWHVATDEIGVSQIEALFNSNELVFSVDNPGESSWNAQLYMPNLSFEEDKQYQITFDAMSDVTGDITVSIIAKDETVYSQLVSIDNTYSTYTVVFDFDATSQTGLVEFSIDGTVDDVFRFATDAEIKFDNLLIEEFDGTNVVTGTNQSINGDLTIIEPLFLKESGVQVEPYQVSITSEQLYSYLAEQLIIVQELAASGGTGDIESQAALLAEEVILSKVEDAIYEAAKRDVRAELDYETTLDSTIEIIAIEELIELEHVVDEPDWALTLSTYITDHYESLLISSENRLFLAEYVLIYDGLFDVTDSSVRLTQYLNNYNKFYNQLYGEFAVENETLLAFQTYLYDKFASGNLPLDNDDANKMLLRIYYQTEPEVYETLIDKLDNAFYERSGFFIKGVWGAVSLGSVPQTSVYEHKVLSFLLPATSSDAIEYQQIQIEGHHSTRLLLNGIIAMIAIFYLLIVYVWNIKDAYKTSIDNYNSEVRRSEKQYFKDLYENFFEYIVLSPALIIISFISIMPIFFGIAVAFTNYNIENIPPGHLVSWVGFTNFVEVFSITSGSSIDFGGQFWKVFSWTLIWAFSATFTCFFGGFIQAVIISNKRVVFRKAWRSILILPWAVPALISQMMFRVMFQDTGYVNQVLAKAGITNWFMDMGFLGKTYAEAINVGPVERFFHMGTQSFEWLSNEANPWFVRIFIIVLNVWLGFPFFMALMSGVMTSIDKSLYEAASIDGATGFQQFRYITMPLVLFATSPLLVMTFSGNFNNFGVIYFITGGGPGAADYNTAFAGQTDILISWIYSLTTDANIRWYNMASVFSILIFLIVGSVSAWNFTRTRAFREGD